jgi:hypothetical protein
LQRYFFFTMTCLCFSARMLRAGANPFNASRI